ncbi:MAG: helix-turn-helix domain-containing protein [Velocimicrobium sp.]
MFKYNYDAVEFGARIKGVRKKYKMTQEKLAELLYLSVDSVSRIENGKGMCMPEHVVHICEIFNVTADYLYFGNVNVTCIKSNTLQKICKMLGECGEAELKRLEKVISLFLNK